MRYVPHLDGAFGARGLPEPSSDRLPGTGVAVEPPAPDALPGRRPPVTSDLLTAVSAEASDHGLLGSHDAGGFKRLHSYGENERSVAA